MDIFEVEQTETVTRKEAATRFGGWRTCWRVTTRRSPSSAAG